MGAGVVDRDFGGEVLCLKNNGGSEVRERTTLWDVPFQFHRLGAFAEESLITLAPNQSKILSAARQFINDSRKLVLGLFELLPCLNTLGF
jgi:hypothetical protein